MYTWTWKSRNYGASTLGDAISRSDAMGFVGHIYKNGVPIYYKPW